MSKFFSVGGMSPTGGEGNQGGGVRKKSGPAMPTKEQLEARHPAFYKNRPEAMTSPFADVGDRVKIHGDEAEVRHVERNADGSQDVTLQRSVRGDSGTYLAKVEPAANRTQRISKLKRSFD